jgi:hypothetical protein
MTVNTATQTLVRTLYQVQWSTWLLRLFYFVSAFLVIAVLAFNIFQPIKVLPRGFAWFANQDGVANQ